MGCTDFYMEFSFYLQQCYLLCVPESPFAVPLGLLVMVTLYFISTTPNGNKTFNGNILQQYD